MTSPLLLLLVIAFAGFSIGMIYLSTKNAGKKPEGKRDRLCNAWQNVVRLRPFLESAIARYGLSESISLERITPYREKPSESMNPEEKEAYYSLLCEIAEDLRQAAAGQPVLQQAQPLREVLLRFKTASEAYESARQDYRSAAGKHGQALSHPPGKISRRMSGKTE